MSGNPPHGHQGYESGYTDGRPQPYGPPQRHVIGYHNQPMLHLSALQVAYVEDDRESSRQYESQLSGSSRATGYPQPEVERESRPVAPTLGDYNFNIDTYILEMRNMFFPEWLIQQELEKYIHMDRDVMERFIHGEPLNTLEHLWERNYRATVPPGLSRTEITQRRIVSQDIPPQFVQRSGQFTNPVHRNDYRQSAPYVRLAPTSAEMELGNGDRIRRSPRRHRPRPERQEFGSN